MFKYEPLEVIKGLYLLEIDKVIYALRIPENKP